MTRKSYIFEQILTDKHSHETLQNTKKSENAIKHYGRNF